MTDTLKQAEELIDNFESAIISGTIAYKDGRRISQKGYDKIAEDHRLELLSLISKLIEENERLDKPFFDMNGDLLSVGDYVNVYTTFNKGEHISDCIYRVVRGFWGDIQLEFVGLLWESFGYNQYPLRQTLCCEYRGLCVDYVNGKTRNLAVKDEDNTDYSNYIVKINNKELTQLGHEMGDYEQ